MTLDNKLLKVIYRKDNEDKKTTYSTMISKKLSDGNYDNAFIEVQFRKDVEVPNKTKIKLDNAFLTFYKVKRKVNDKEYEVPVFYIKILEFTVIKTEDPFDDFDIDSFL